MHRIHSEYVVWLLISINKSEPGPRPIWNWLCALFVVSINFLMYSSLLYNLMVFAFFGFRIILKYSEADKVNDDDEQHDKKPRTSTQLMARVQKTIDLLHFSHCFWFWNLHFMCCRSTWNKVLHCFSASHSIRFALCGVFPFGTSCVRTFSSFFLSLRFDSFCALHSPRWLLCHQPLLLCLYVLGRVYFGVEKPIYSNTAPRHWDKNLCVYKWDEIFFALLQHFSSALIRKPKKQTQHTRCTVQCMFAITASGRKKNKITLKRSTVRKRDSGWKDRETETESESEHAKGTTKSNWIAFNRSQSETNFNWNSFRNKNQRRTKCNGTFVTTLAEIRSQ